MIRIREIVLTAVALLLVTSIAVAASNSASHAPDDEGPFVPKPTEPKRTVASGTVNGSAYSVRAFESNTGDICMEIVYSARDVVGECGPAPTSAQPLATISDETPGKAERLTVGLAAPSVARIDVGGDVDRSITPETKPNLTSKVFVVKRQRGQTATPSLTARSRAGDVVR